MAAGGGAGGPSTLTTAVPSALKRPDIRVHTSVTEGGGGDDGNGEPKVDESIELGPPTRLLDGWSVRATEAPAAVPREDDNDDDSRQATMSEAGAAGGLQGMFATKESENTQQSANELIGTFQS